MTALDQELDKHLLREGFEWRPALPQVYLPAYLPAIHVRQGIVKSSDFWRGV